ncbi:MAG: PC4/YdbC family ssDNA-binding protein [Sphingomonadales bacterium]|jgi:hypothetical protein
MSDWLFEHPYRGYLWRLEVQTYRGQTSANWRKWYRDKEGEWRRSRDGVTFPLEKLRELTADLLEHHGVEAPEALRTSR